MQLFKIKCFLVNLLKQIHQLCLTWLCITYNINIFIIWRKVLLGNKLNDFYLDPRCFLVFKYFLFRVCFSLNEETEIFLIIILVSWGAVTDLEISSSLLLDTKLGALFFHFVFHLWFLVIVLLGSPLNSSEYLVSFREIFYFILNVW